MSEDSFWTKANEDQFESLDLFQDLEKTFGTGRARNVELDSGPKLKLPKIKELKVLDTKSAQNICEFDPWTIINLELPICIILYII